MKNSQNDALCKIATDALRAIQKDTRNVRHSDLWGLAISRINQTKHDVEADEELAAAIRQPPPRAA